MPSEAWSKKAKTTTPRGAVNMADKASAVGVAALEGEEREGREGEEVVLGQSTMGRKIKASARLMASN